MSSPSICSKKGYVIRGKGNTYLSRNFNFVPQGIDGSEGMDEAWVHEINDILEGGEWTAHAVSVYPARYCAAGDVTVIQGDPVPFMDFAGDHIIALPVLRIA